MENYIQINGKRIELTAEQVAQLTGKEDYTVQTGTLLSKIVEGDTFKICGNDFIVLEHIEEVGTAIIRKEVFEGRTEFAEEDSNYDGSLVDDICNSFEEVLENEVGAENIVEHDIDLTSDDGLKDYGIIRRKVALLTAEQYRKYVHILDKHRVNSWWWLATACSTKTHDWSTAVKCVSPSGYIYFDFCHLGHGVRPFCILKSSIFVSK